MIEKKKTKVTNPVTQKKMMTKMMIVIKKGVTVAMTQRKLRLQFQNQSSQNKNIWP
jgi:hypothetical protein